MRKTGTRTASVRSERLFADGGQGSSPRLFRAPGSRNGRVRARAPSRAALSPAKQVANILHVKIAASLAQRVIHRCVSVNLCSRKKHKNINTRPRTRRAGTDAER